jgi:PKD repeat protein
VKFLIKASLAILAALAFGVSAQPTRPHPIKPPFPQIELPQKARGARAIELLGARLPEVAAWYGKSAEEFAAIFQRDRTAWIDRRGRMYYEEELEAPPQAGTATGNSLTLNGSLAPLDQTFKLHSRPGAKRTIYLDFDGATLTNTAWNTSTQPSITAEPFDLDGVPYSFSSAELERIQMIWQRVAEDFAPFDVNVTTEVPAAGALSRSSSSDDTFGTTVLITRNTFRSCSCGGTAYVGSFDETTDYYKPALVFAYELGGNEKYVAEAISHEAGHNLGLNHDGTSGSGYYTGHNGWAPIMGIGYHQPLVQWSRGEYPDANNKEDDYTVMAANGLPLRADDHGNTTGSATTLGSSTVSGVTTLVGGGIIERSTDIDVFSFVAGAGTISIAVNPAARSANLDVRADLMDGSGKVLVSANPVDALNGALSFTTSSSGTFFVAVRGTGKGDLTTGYSNYGSLGEYRISGSVSASASQPPVAVLSANPTSGVAPLTTSFSASGSYDPDGSIASYEWNFGDGSAPVYGVTASRTYSTVGSYTATLKVTDNAGLTATRIVTISADSAVVTVPMSVAGVTVTLKTSKSGHAEAIADVLVKDGSNNPVGGATVTGTWSGVVSGSASGVTNTSGVTSMKSPRTKTKGTFTFTVTGVAREGYLYTPTSNFESTDSATR